MNTRNTDPIRYRAYTNKTIDSLPQFRNLSTEQRNAIQAVSRVLPFRVNNYVVDNLIDWDDIPRDPIFQMTFPQEGMISSEDFKIVSELVANGATKERIEQVVQEIRLRLNPHPAGQMELNVPSIDGYSQEGMQHKYRETVLFFPSEGQTCHAYCTYCFRWAQFVGMDELKFANKEADSLVRYVRSHPEVRDVLFTGGDPMIMKTGVLETYIRPLLDIESLHTIRIGTKAPAWWPHRFVTNDDADALLRLFEDVVNKGKHLALMSHYSHPRELSTPVSALAVRRIQGTGATIRSQAPLIRQVNDSAHVWASMWQRQVDMGIIPYYMFVERDTGPQQYFEVPLHRALEIFTHAIGQVSGLGRTVRGPSMSCTPGKILIDGVSEINGERVFALKFLQGRDPNWTNKLFFAKYDEDASWIDDLEPAFTDRFFFQDWFSEPRKWNNVATYRDPRAEAAATSPALRQ